MKELIISSAPTDVVFDVLQRSEQLFQALKGDCNSTFQQALKHRELQ